MTKFTKGTTRVVLQQPDLTGFQNNGSVVLDSRRTRPLWFDGRFLAAKDLEREQNYFLQRQADLGRAAGFGVIHGLMVDRGPVTGQAADTETIVIHAGDGVTPAGELVMIPSDLTIRLSDLAEEENLGVQFGISTMPQQPARTRTGLFVLALRPVEFTANPITSYPTSIQGSRTTRDGDIVEATAVSLVPYPNPINNLDSSLTLPTIDGKAPTAGAVQQAALARQIFVGGNEGTLSDSLLPLAMVGISNGSITWLDPYMVRRDSGPQYSGVRFGLTDPATQQAYLLQYHAALHAVVAARQSMGQAANFAATDYFQALPSAGPFPMDAINTNNFSQVFFPQQMDVRLSIIPTDDLPALVEDSMSLPPIDLTLPSDAYTNLAVFALIPVPRNIFASLKSSLPDTPLNPTMPQVLANRSPLQLLRLFQGNAIAIPASAVSNSAWATAIGSRKYGFYIRRRSEAVYVDFTTVSLSSSLNPSTFGQAVTFTVNVTPGSATGSIQFNDGTTALGAPVTIGGGSAAITVASLAGGVHSITAVYGGDGINAGSTSAVLTQLVATPATVALTSSVNPSTFGQKVILTATVSPSSATGTVQFMDGTKSLGTQPLGGGTAAITLSNLTVGTHNITAVYSGDANDAGNTSPALAQTVNKVTSSAAVASSLNPATVGQGVTFTATVTPASATGSVQFNSGPAVGTGPSVSLGSSPVTGGKATVTTSSLAVGARAITAAYGGDTNNTASTSPALIQNIAAAVSGVVVSSLPNPSIVGQSVTFTATVTPASATGTVQFNDGTTALGAPAAVSGGQATLAVTTLTVGTHSITAVYSGDGNDAGSTSPVVTQTVNRVASGVALTSGLNPSTVGQGVIFTALVNPVSATGSVQFLDGTTSLSSVPLSGGKVALTVTTLTLGAHPITAAYSGDTNNAPATSTVVTQNVNQVVTSAAITSSLNPSTVGQTVTFTATVAPASATGTVQFKDGAGTLGAPVTLSGGTAVLAVSSLSLGSHSITAAYSGDANNAPATSSALAQSVNQLTSGVAVVSSLNPALFGQSVTLTATLTPGSATGTVQFKDGAASLGAPVPVSGGRAALPATTLAIGVHSITAAYSGDANDIASVSPVFAQAVNSAISSVAVVSSQNPQTAGNSVTFTATVTPSSATGTVQFKDGTTILGAPTISGGTATLSVSLAVGSHPITAAYLGDLNDSASTSAVLTQTVTQVSAGVTVTSSQNPSTTGQTVTFTALVTPVSATGTVQFRDVTANLGTAVPVSGGKAALSVSTLTLGSHSITAAYSGDANTSTSSSGALTQTVIPVASSVVVTASANPTTFGQAITFTATVTPASATGTVQLRDGTTILGTPAIANGVATLTVPAPSNLSVNPPLAVGAHSITGAYSGDANNLASTSAVLTQTVNKATASVVVTSQASQATTAAAFTTLTATLTPPTATGTVTFTDNALPLGSGPVTISGGKAVLSVVLPAGIIQVIVAVYSGDANFSPAISLPI